MWITIHCVTSFIILETDRENRMDQQDLGRAQNSTDNISPMALAALFANDFSLDWIIELTGLKATRILVFIDQALEKRWLQRIGAGMYRFRDPKKKAELIHMLPPKMQARWRRMIVDLLLREIPVENEMATAAAYHLLYLSNDEAGCRQLIRAGDIRRNSFDLQGALKCYQKVCDDMRPGKSEEAYRLFTDAVVAYSKIVEVAPDIAAIIPQLQEAVLKAKQRKDKVRTALLELHLAKNEWLRTNFEAAYRYFDRGWETAKTSTDDRLKRSAQGIGAFFLYGQGRYNEVIQQYEEVMTDIEKTIPGRVPLLSAQFIGACYAYNGQITRGMGMLDAVYSHCQKTGDFFVGSYTGFHIGGILIELGRIDEAIRYLKMALEQAGQVSNDMALVINNLYLSIAYYYNNDVETSVEYLKKCVKISKEFKLVISSVSHLFLVLLWEMEIGRYPRIVSFSIEDQTQTMLNGNDPFPKGIAYRYRSVRDERKGVPSDSIIESLLLSEKWLKESGHEIQLAWTRLLLARQYLSAGDEKQAHTVIQNSSDLLDTFLQERIPDDLRFLLKDLRTDKNLLTEIMKMGQELVCIRNDQDLVRRILAVVNRITGAERSAVFLLKEGSNTQEVILRAARNLTEEDISRPEFSSSMAIILDAVHAGEYRCRLLDSISKSDLLAKEAIRSCICVPMKLRDKVTGVLYVDNRFFPSVFKESDSEILDYFAAQAAIALDNAAVHVRNRVLIQKLEGEKQYFEEQYLDDMSSEGFIGSCEAVRQVLLDVTRVAETDSTVLILGETGVGKELIARAIHQNSARKDRPFIRVNCSAFPETLIAGELFGHEKGAFTGAVERRLGRFELADGGTLFLDEIGDISIEVQVRLLRVLQSHEFERIGGKETLHSDFRLLTATNRNLQQAVKGGTFREDLFYRLNVFPIHIPPLRERKEDIPLLVAYFLKRYAEKTGKSLGSPSNNDMNQLIAYHWPGNVRELNNLIERGAILSSGTQFRLPELDHAGLTVSKKGELITLVENERQHILAALKRSGGKVRGKGGAAELLDINYNTLFSRMKKLGINKSDIAPKLKHNT